MSQTTNKNKKYILISDKEGKLPGRLRIPTSPLHSRISSAFLAHLSSFFFVFLIAWLILCASADRAIAKQDSPTAKTDRGELSYVFTVNGKIVKVPYFIEKDSIMIDLDSFRAVLAEMGASSEFDAAGGILTVNFSGAVQIGAAQGFPPPGKSALVIIINGKIFKTDALKKSAPGGSGKNAKLYITLPVAEKIIAALGGSTETALSARVTAVTKPGGIPSPAPSSNGPAAPAVDMPPSSSASPAPASSPTDTQSAGVKDTNLLYPDLPAVSSKKAVAPFMASLKKIFDTNKLSKEDQDRFSFITGELGKNIPVKRENLEKVRNKYAAIREQIRMLKPPDRETAAIRDLAAGVFDNMVRVMDIVMDLMNLSVGFDNPKLVEEIQTLNTRITQDGAEFNERVKAIRKKYDLGNP